jgi:hypothetical protein
LHLLPRSRRRGLEGIRKRTPQFHRMQNMRPNSSFCFTCLCGQQVELEQMEGHCPGCQRRIRVEWPDERSHRIRAVCVQNLGSMTKTKEKDYDEKHQPGDPTR